MIARIVIAVLLMGILWTAHVEVPAAGAPVNVSAADLKLPPETKP